MRHQATSRSLTCLKLSLKFLLIPVNMPSATSLIGLTSRSSQAIPLNLSGRYPTRLLCTTLTVLHFQIRVISRFRSWYFSIFSYSLMFTLVSKGKATSKIRHVLSSLFNTTISGLLCSRGWSVWILNSHNNFIMSDSSTACGSWLYHFAPLSKSYLSQNCQWIICATLSCLQSRYWFWANILHSARIWLIDSSLPTLPARSRYCLLFDSILYTAWSCAAMIKPSVSFFNLPSSSGINCSDKLDFVQW